MNNRHLLLANDKQLTPPGATTPLQHRVSPGFIFSHFHSYDPKPHQCIMSKEVAPRLLSWEFGIWMWRREVREFLLERGYIGILTDLLWLHIIQTHNKEILGGNAYVRYLVLMKHQRSCFTVWLRTCWRYSLLFLLLLIICCMAWCSLCVFTNIMLIQ